MKQTLVVLYRNFYVGGIETNFADIMKNALRKNRRVIWVGDIGMQYDPLFSGLMENNSLEKVCMNYSPIKSLPVPDLQFGEDEEVCITVTSIRSLYIAYKIREKHPTVKIKIFYIVPLFTGCSIFLEQSFKVFLHSWIKNYTKNFYQRVYNHHSLHFFSKTFANAIESAYDIKLNDSYKYCVPYVKEREPFNPEYILENRKKGIFTIVSAGRFEYPHKGFALGLVESFTTIHSKYPNTKLVFIGDGPDKSKLLDKIKQQPVDVQECIQIVPPVSKDELTALFKQYDLNISVAGCATIGARAGVPTLPARHYYEKCEVYGFFPDSKDLTTERKPGIPVEDFIEQAINMTDTEYLKLASDTYHCFDNVQVDTDYPFSFDCDTSYIPSKKEYILAKLIYIKQRIDYQLAKFRKKGTEKN